MPLEDLRQTRIAKVADLRKNNIDPYPAVSHRQLDLSQVVSQFDDLEKQPKQLLQQAESFLLDLTESLFL